MTAKTTHPPAPLVIVPEPFVPLKEAVRLLAVAEATVRNLADSGVIECIRDVNNERRFSRDSIARYLFLKQQTDAAKTYRESSKRMARALEEGRKRRGKG